MFWFRRRSTASAATPLTEYLYIDRNRLYSYIEQLNAANVLNNITWDFSMGLAGPQIRGQRSTSRPAKPDHAMLSELIKYLDSHGMLSKTREAFYMERQHGFVLEDMTAIKAVFPIPPDTPMHGLKEIAVWVSCPTHTVVNSRKVALRTFVYLIQAHWDSDGPYERPMSGYSALACLAYNLAKSKIILPTVAEPLGLTGSHHPRWLDGATPSPTMPAYVSPSDVAEVQGPFDGRTGEPKDLRNFDHLLGYQHPINILQRLGAVVQPSRRIRSLYRKRYFNDEQFYTDWKGKRLRANDLAAYPIFIEAL